MASPDSAKSDTALRVGQEALAQGAWAEARAAFEKATASAKDDPEAWAGLGLAAWWQEDYAASMSAREQAFRLFSDRDDRRGMARMCFYLALDHLDFKGSRGEPRAG